MADKDSANTICASGSGSTLAYKLVTIEVTWPGMGQLKPVRADTLKAIDTFDSTSTGNVAMSVTGFDGVLADVPVTLTPSTGPVVGPQATGGDGCTFFSNFATGVYTATPNLAGYVGTSNTLSPQLSVSAANPTLVRATLTYAAARSANVALDLPAGSTLVPGVVVQLQGTFMTVHSIPTCLSTTTSECITGLPGMLKNVYPDTYTVKAGTCTETAPSAQSIPLTGAASALPTVTVPFGAITVNVQTLLGAPVVGRPVTFTHLAPATGCTEPPYSITSATAGSMVALPYGTWTVATTSVGTGIGVILSQTVTVGPVPLSRTGAAALKVFS
jgi:hypothetical protein